MSDAPLDLERLRDIMAALRAEDGCPWDRRQDLSTMKGYLLEECYEVLDVMDGADADAHKEELGDLLFQIVFHAQLRSERGEFGLRDAIASISDKLVRRHPHVFGTDRVTDPEVVKQLWHAQKLKEGKGGVADVPRALPALMRAQKVTKRAGRVGFDWQSVDGPLHKIDEERRELLEAIESGDQAAIASELGDLLFAVVNVARHLDVSAESALSGTTDRFVARFSHVEAALAAQQRRFETTDEAELDALWEAAKAELG